MSNVIEALERKQLRDDVPVFKAGDTVQVHFQVIEGTRRRIQVFEGICIKRQGNGVRETFTVRKQSSGIGVERTFPVHSPKIEKIVVKAIGDVNRATTDQCSACHRGGQLHKGHTYRHKRCSLCFPVAAGLGKRLSQLALCHEKRREFLRRQRR